MKVFDRVREKKDPKEKGCGGCMRKIFTRFLGSVRSDAHRGWRKILGLRL